MSVKTFRTRVRQSLADENLQLALKDLLGGTKVNRRATNQIIGTSTKLASTPPAHSTIELRSPIT